MAKKELSSVEIYELNKKKAKIFKIISPICFWGFLALGVLCLILAIKNSFGNIVEILDLLDNKQYTGEQLQTNYAYLINKYGEWVIGNGGNGFTISFVNIGKAVFSGLMLTNIFLSLVFFLSSYILGKLVLPKISNQILLDNQDMVNIKVLKDKDRD